MTRREFKIHPRDNLYQPIASELWLYRHCARMIMGSALDDLQQVVGYHLGTAGKLERYRSRNSRPRNLHAQQFSGVHKHQNIRPQMQQRGLNRAYPAHQRCGDAQHMDHAYADE